jgi:hypothetical protein
VRVRDSNVDGNGVDGCGVDSDSNVDGNVGVGWKVTGEGA